MQLFTPLFSSGHFQTIAAHYWPRSLDVRRYPVERRLVPTEPDVQVLVESQRPPSPRADLVLLHGLEGSSEAGYMLSMAQAALDAGLAVHRMNLRSCGGTEHLCRTLYHSGLTVDLLALLRDLEREGRAPAFVAGYSLGGNVALKLAGELGDAARSLMSGVGGVSVPIDLAACVTQMERPENRLYELRFLRCMKARLRYRHRLMPDVFSIDGLDRIRSVREFDDRITGPSFGFSGAAEYYATQSAARCLAAIRVPALLIAAQDDPLVPFEVVRQAALRGNPNIRLLAPEHGGHVGFLSRRRPRFWSDAAIVEWIGSLLTPGSRPFLEQTAL